MKKFLLIALAVAGFAVASAPSSQAGISVGIGFGGPVGYYPGCYPYPYYGYYRPYPYYGYYGGYRSYSYRPYYGYRGRRVYYARHRHWR